VPTIGGWTQPAVSLALAAVYAVPYLVRARTLRHRGQAVGRWRLACFGGGLLLLAVAVSPPIAETAEDRLSVHMLEHLVIGDLAPLLIVLGLTRALIAPVLRAPGVWRMRVFAHPLAALVLWAGSLYFWHLRFAYEAAVDHELVHVLQHACFFLAGANLWFALLGPLPKPEWFGNGARLAYVLTVWVAGMMLANGFTWSSTAFYPHYAQTAADAGRSATTDQSAAGAVMLVEQSVVIVTLLGWLLARALRDAGRREELAELAAAHGVALDERRIARAVASEQHDALAARLRSAPAGRSADTARPATRPVG
jgi:cytochrome c oxidase assembly factor CtaG